MILPNSSIYFARCIGWDGTDMHAFKIGMSHVPDERTAAISSQLPFACEIVATAPGDLFVEGVVHMWLRNHKLGGEYYKAEGETLVLVEFAKRHGRLPFPITHDGNTYSLADVDIKSFMEKHGLDFDEVERLAGVSAGYYRKLFDDGTRFNRRFLAAVAVSVMRRGFSVQWPLDFIPAVKAAA